MPITYVDLLEPKGPVDPAMFPKDDATALHARLTAYVNDGYARAADVLDPTLQDEAAARWARFRAYTAVANRKNLEATSMNLADQGGKAFAAGQAKYYADLAAGELADFRELVPETLDPAPAADPDPAGS